MAASTVSLILHVPKPAHTEVIGKGGATVKQIQTDADVRVMIPPRDDASDVISILGTAENVKKAKALIERAVGIKVGEEPLVTVSLEVPEKRFGAIIGPEGSTRKNIRSLTNCEILVPRKEDSDRSVRVIGTKGDAEKCIVELEKLLGQQLNINGEMKKASVETPKLPLTGLTIAESLFFPDPSENSFNRFLQYLKSATKTLDVCVFTITDDRISRALMESKARGIKVRIITDNDTSIADGSDIAEMKKMGIPVLLDPTPYHLHHKFAILDGVLLINGSFNWTRSASIHNYENVLITNEPKFVKEYEKEFIKLWKLFENEQK